MKHLHFSELTQPSIVKLFRYWLTFNHESGHNSVTELLRRINFSWSIIRQRAISLRDVKTQPDVFNDSSFLWSNRHSRCLRTTISRLLLVVQGRSVSLSFSLSGTRLWFVFVAPSQSGGNLRPPKPQLPLGLYTLTRHVATNRSGNVYSALLPVVPKDFWISLPAAIWKSTTIPYATLFRNFLRCWGFCCAPFIFGRLT